MANWLTIAKYYYSSNKDDFGSLSIAIYIDIRKNTISSSRLV